MGTLQLLGTTGIRWVMSSDAADQEWASSLLKTTQSYFTTSITYAFSNNPALSDKKRIQSKLTHHFSRCKRVQTEPQEPSI